MKPFELIANAQLSLASPFGVMASGPCSFLVNRSSGIGRFMFLPDGGFGVVVEVI